MNWQRVYNARNYQARGRKMEFRYILTDYIQQAMSQAVYEDLGDGTFSATIPPCWGVLAFGETLSECRDELQSVLEDWILTGLWWKHPLPVVAGIDLNPVKEPAREPVESL